MRNLSRRSPESLASAWSSLIALISARSRLPVWRLEVFFEVGDATGRVWNTWKTQSRVARQETRRRIIQKAFVHGWIIPTPRQLKELQYLDDPIIQRMANDQRPHIAVPALLLRLCGMSPWIAADWLLGIAKGDYDKSLDRHYKRRDKPSQPIPTEFFPGASDAINAVESQIRAMRNGMLRTPHQTKDAEHVDRIIRTAIAVRYQDLLSAIRRDINGTAPA